MRKERGWWSKETIPCCLNTVERFFFRLDERGVTLASVGTADIDREIARYRARACSRVTIHDYAKRLRTFFRFAEQSDWCAQGLPTGSCRRGSIQARRPPRDWSGTRSCGVSRRGKIETGKLDGFLVKFSEEELGLFREAVLSFNY